MYERPDQRVNALKSRIEMPVIEQIYLETNCIKIIRPNILRNAE